MHSMHRVRAHAIRTGLSRHLRCGTNVIFNHRPEQSRRACRESSSSAHYVRDDDSSDAHALHLRTDDHLRIAVPASVAHALIAPALPRFLQQHPTARVQLVISDEVSHCNQFDAAIWIHSIESDAQPDARRLAVIPHVVCASEEFLAVHGTPRSAHELNPAHCIGVIGQDMKLRSWSLRRDAAQVTIVPKAPLMFSDAQSAVVTAVRGGGMILVPALAVEAQIGAQLLTPLLPDWSAPGSAVWMQQTGPLTSELEAFADFVADLFPPDTG
jgi:LysR family transcriptional regulator, regulator for bpeEF and oprC